MATPNPIAGNQFYTSVVDLAAQLPSLNVGGDLTVGGSITPGTFTNRAIQLVDVGGAGTIATLTAASSGSVFLIPALAAGAQVVNLPAATAAGVVTGVNYTFLVQVALNAGTLNITAQGTDEIEGQVCTGANTTTAHVAATTVVIAATALPGMQMTVRFKGTGTAATDVWDVQTGSYSAAFV